MRKGKYIDYAILLACLSKKPEQSNNGKLVNGITESKASEETQKDKVVKVLELEPA